MWTSPARAVQVRALFEYAADEIVERVVETGASIDEVVEALKLVEFGPADAICESARIEEVREILLVAKQRHDTIAMG